MNELVARWESRSGKHWVELRRVDGGYEYTAPGCGGYLGDIPEPAAVSEVERRVADGYFQPDRNTTLMRRVA